MWMVSLKSVLSFSCRAEDKIRHYMIDKDKKNKKYLIVNEDVSFKTLRDLVDHYKKVSIGLLYIHSL